jgi:Type I phosphodiesterase / nucleotide pyrophosphatase
VTDHSRSAVIVLADGARAEVFERMLAAGELPAIADHVVARGSHRRATSTFTSTTGPAHVPILTGCFAGTADVPGYRWFERRAYRPGLWPGQWCMRSYNGPEALLLNRDLSPRVRTLYELTREPINVFGVVTRGIPGGRSLYGRRKRALWPYIHYSRRWGDAEPWAARGLAESVSIPSELRFVAFPGIDWYSHYVDPDGDGALECYRRIDRAVGEVADALRRTRAYDDTLIVVLSDHGHTRVRTHYDLPVRLEDDFGIRVAYHSRAVFKRDPEAVACVSGNGMCQVYLRGEDWRAPPPTRDEIDIHHPGLRERLIAQAAIDLVITRAADGPGLWIESRRGRARLDPLPGGVAYLVEQGDPFGWEQLPERMTWEEALAATFDTGHPDALVQTVQLFRSPRAGDLVVSAAPGYDLRERYEHPEHLSSHGALHSGHMIVPVASSTPLAEGPMRTADIFATVLRHLGRGVPDGIDGISRLAGSPAPA